jgi:Flp pilus assembly protein TadG
MFNLSSEAPMKTTDRLRKALLGFVVSGRGTAAIEFAFIVPVLTLIVVTLADVATIAVGMGEMQTAARAAIQYAIAGGTDMTVAQTQGLNAWNSKPSNGAITATLACLCGTTPSDCQVLCADQSYPKEYITVSASGTLSGRMISKNESLTEVVRVR